MAGGTVFQFEKHSIETEDFMTTEYAIDTPFYDTIADYVYEVDDRECRELYLSERLLLFNKDRELVVVRRNARGTIASVFFREGFKEAYFAQPFVKFMELLAQVSVSSTPSSYANGSLDTLFDSLCLAYKYEYGDYVCTNECEFITFDEFIRSVEIDVPYYLGGIIGFHM